MASRMEDIRVALDGLEQAKSSLHIALTIQEEYVNHESHTTLTC